MKKVNRLPRDPKDISLSAPERQTRRTQENEENARLGARNYGSGTGPAGPEGKEGPQGPPGSVIAITRGVANVTFSSSAFSAEVTVTHGLGSTPSAVQLTGVKSGGIFVIPNLTAAPGATTFKIQATVNGGTLNTTVQVHWTAIA